MISREDVAKKIRKIDEYDCYETAIYEIDTIIGTEKSPLFSDFLNRLADLIDPTCSVDITEQHEIENVTRYTGECSSCGAVFGDFTTRQKARATHPTYCPCCGARVVQDDRR